MVIKLARTRASWHWGQAQKGVRLPAQNSSAPAMCPSRPQGARTLRERDYGVKTSLAAE